MRAAERRRRALAALGRVGFATRAENLPSQLSGGQQQRVAIATDPVRPLADEPTVALDSRSTADVLALFDGFNADGRTVIVITHEPDVAAHAKRVLRMRDGKIVSDERVAASTDPPQQWSGAAARARVAAGKRR